MRQTDRFTVLWFVPKSYGWWVRSQRVGGLPAAVDATCETVVSEMFRKRAIATFRWPALAARRIIS